MASVSTNNLIESDNNGSVCQVYRTYCWLWRTRTNFKTRPFGIKFITSPEIIYLARNAGFHASFIDLEHSSLSLKTANHLCVAALNANLSPFVRVPGHAEASFIQRVLDNSAQGIIFPHVDTPGKHLETATINTDSITEQAQAAVIACKYPPLGKRSITGMLPHVGFKSISITEASEIGNSQLSTVIAMIESPEGVANVDLIAAVDGVDMVLIGTNDPSIELGVPGDFDHPKFVESLQKIAISVKKHNKHLGVAGIYNRPDIIHKFIHDYGARFVVGHVDLPLVAKSLFETASVLQNLEGSEKYLYN